MASVFLSYDHEDVAHAAALATALEAAGHSVWWDRHIRGGAEYNTEIEGAVERADAVVVLWSERSVHSAWVRDEAAEGRDAAKLVPVALDGTKPPMGFRQYQTIDLCSHKGKRAVPDCEPLLEAIKQLVSGSEQRQSLTAHPSATPQRARISLALAALILLLLVGGGVIAWGVLQPSSSVPVVAVAPADRSAAAQALARDLLVKLGSLRSAKTDSVRLIGGPEDGAREADFVFEAVADADRTSARGNLALLRGKERSILWSKDFEVEGGSKTALQQSMAYTAGQVLDCAVQASESSGKRLDEQTLKLFLNGCALFGDRYRSDPASVVPIFTRVVALAPTFEPAWSKLLLAEAQNTRGQMLFYDRLVPGRLPEHIQAARKLNPRLPELYLAETALLPLDAFDDRLKLIDEAIELNPDNPDLRVSRSEFLSALGRNSDAVDDGRRAAEINPLSPGFRSNLIQILAYGGQLAAAQEELRRAEQLWPGSSTIQDARFRLASRFGDPKEALRMLRSPDFRQYYSTVEMEAYLQARINPTEQNVRLAIAASQSPQLTKIRRWVQLVQLLADFGRTDEIYDLLTGMSPHEARLVSGVIYRPAFAKFRQDPRFIRIAAHAGLINFWRRSGKWPDFCFEPGRPYDCKAEAAKLK